MKTSESTTVIRLLFFIFRLIFATAHPSTQERISTSIEIKNKNTSPPKTDFTENETFHQYTTIAGRITEAEYISPIRYTLSSLDTIMALTGIGIDSNKSLSLDKYKLENVLNTLPNAPRKTEVKPIRAKYIQSIPTALMGSQRTMESAKNIPPITPTINKTNAKISNAVLA